MFWLRKKKRHEQREVFLSAKEQINYYLILNISPKSDSKEIKKAYIKLAQTYHPDKNRGNRLAEKKFQQINRAWQVLKDPEKRQSFDERLAVEKQRKQAVLNSKKSFPATTLQTKKETPIDLEVSLTVSLEDLCLSRVKKLSYFKPINGKKKKHSFDFRIPLGSKPGTKLYFRGKGGSEGKEIFGDLYVKLYLSQHKIFQISQETDSSDLFLERPISFVDVIERKKVEILSPYGSLLLKQSLSLKDNQILKVKGHGLPENQKGDKGDLFIKIVIDYPAGKEAEIRRKIKRMSFEQQKVYVRQIKKRSVIYSKVLKFQKITQELKKEL